MVDLRKKEKIMCIPLREIEKALNSLDEFAGLIDLHELIQALSHAEKIEMEVEV